MIWVYVTKGAWLMKRYHESGYITNFWNMLLLTLETILYFSYLCIKSRCRIFLNYQTLSQELF